MGLREKTLEYIKMIFDYFDLESELENHEQIHEEILKGIIFKGTNLWILVFAIIVASVGLNMNSTAVIIGAMLISPLMGPINGMGYSVATYNFELFRKSIKNFSFAVVTSLVASTAYFFLSPISTAHSELLARTSPSIYDVLIALFGGLAGIVAISSKQKGNVIPGVAIATALMPPLCTAGYGLASGKIDFFLGALYLFTINTVFIALASVVISQFLKFPIRALIDAAQRKRINQLISTIIAIVLLPSIYFGYSLVKKEKFIENANTYISNVSTFEGNYLLKSDINPDERAITLVYGGLNLSERQKEEIISKADNFSLSTPTIRIRQGLTFEDGTSARANETLRLKEQLQHLTIALRERETQVDSMGKLDFMGETVLKEIRTLYPQIVGCAYAESLIFSDSLKKPEPTAVVFFDTKGAQLKKEDEEKITNWVQIRSQKRRTKVVFE